MIGILTIILAFIVFLLIVEKCCVASSPVSLAILIIISVFLGYIFANILAYLIEIGIVVAIIAIVVLLSKKKDKNE